MVSALFCVLEDFLPAKEAADMAEGKLREDLAEEYETHPTNITHMVKFRTWRHV